jgi:hypothetical protein
LKAWVAAGRLVVKEFQKTAACLPFPGRQVGEALIQEREREMGFDGLLLDEGKQRADIGRSRSRE